MVIPGQAEGRLASDDSGEDKVVAKRGGEYGRCTPSAAAVRTRHDANIKHGEYNDTHLSNPSELAVASSFSR